MRRRSRRQRSAAGHRQQSTQDARLWSIVERMPEPTITETRPGVLDVAFSFPPGTNEEDAQAIISAYLAEVRQGYPGDVRASYHGSERPAHLDREFCVCPECLPL